MTRHISLLKNNSKKSRKSHHVRPYKLGDGAKFLSPAEAPKWGLIPLGSQILRGGPTRGTANKGPPTLKKQTSSSNKCLSEALAL
jgi:hypothetical protein